MIGPFEIPQIMLCSADAGPKSQRPKADNAGYFYPKAKWVGTLRNGADRLGCKFVILTTAHGLVTPEDSITPYDLPLSAGENEERIRAIWEKTFPRILRERRYGIFIIYFGGCPRDPAFKMIERILNPMNISLLTFGRPNMFDIDKLDEIVARLQRGTTLDEIKALLKKPDRLKFVPA
jgi:hypothetical protein